MFCSKCGNTVSAGQQYCSTCGADVSQNHPSQSFTSSLSGSSNPRIWVIIFGGLLCLTCIGLVIGIPLIVTELKKRPSGTHAQNTGWIIAGCVLFAFIAIGAIVGSDESTTPNESAQKISNSAEQSSPTVAAEATSDQSSDYKVGDVIKLDNHAISVTDVVPNFTSSNEFDKPQNSDNVFVAVHVVIKNTSDDDLLVNSMGFELEDENGTKRTETIVAGLNDPLETVTLSKGGTIEGNIAFEAKANSSVLKLYYSGGVFGGGEVVINLKS